jgi:hypothetical protein
LNKKKWSNKPKRDEDENTSNKTPNETNATSLAQGGKDKTCYCCGKIGRLSPECPDKNKIEMEIGTTSRKPHTVLYGSE